MWESSVDSHEQRVLEQLLDTGTWEIDLATRAIVWSEAARGLLEHGQPMPATLAALLDRVHPEDRARVRAACERALSDGAPFDIAHRLVFPDGRVKHVRYAGAPVDGGGRPGARYCGVLQDVSKRVLAEREGQRVREMEHSSDISEELLKQAVRVSGIGIFDHDHVANSIYWSPRQRDIHGWGSDEPLDLEKCAATVHPDDANRITESVRRAHDPSGSGAWEVEYRIVRRDGTIRWLVARSRTFFQGEGAERRPVRTVGAVLDVSDAKRMQEQLHQAQKMESVGRLAGGVAHDFNNLLTVMRGYLDLAVLNLDPLDPLRADLDEVLKAVSSAASLTRQLLSFSRRQVITPQLLDLNEVIERVHKMLRRVLGEDIELRIDRDRPLWPVLFDAGQFEQILINLVANARDAMPKGGRLLIETRNLGLDDDYVRAHPGCVPGDYVLLEVSDDGIGMSREVQTHIFEPFYTTKQPGIGTGLGLATVYGAVQQNNGRIEVYSEVGQGTCFKIYLPRARGKAPVVAADGTATARPICDETILLVEDEASVRTLVTRLLRQWGFQVHAFPDGPSAVDFALATAETVHLLVTDVVMPGMNGCDLAEKLRAIQPAIRVLFTSGYTANVVVNRGLLKEGEEFLAKPYTMDSLGKRIREILDNPGGRPP